MARTSGSGGRRVVVVTGGGAGIGAAIAEELGRNGDLVVTMDPLVSLDGTERLPDPAETTAGRIVAAGGTAQASSVSVTDGDGVRDLFESLVAVHGRLDAVINVAGITRPTSFATGTAEDWLGVLAVHLDGYLNVLRAALPIMAAAGHGRILGVTSGSGWRAADTGAYGCAKRAVASITWELDARAPAGVVVNAMSPIAVTRMVTAALERAARAAAAAPSAAGGPAPSATGGLSLGSMPAPEEIGPVGAHLVSDASAWSRGQVIFAGGSEVAVVDRPRLVEAVRTDGVISLPLVLEAFAAQALAPAEAGQLSGGGSNPRFGPIFDGPVAGELPPSAVSSCAVVADRPAVAAAVLAALEARGGAGHLVDVDDAALTFASAAELLASAEERVGSLDAVVVAVAGSEAVGGASDGWQQLLADHDGIVGHIHADAGWARAVADHAASTGRDLRLVLLTDAATSGGRSRAQAAAQLARAGAKATKQRVAAFAVSDEGAGAHDPRPLGELIAHLVCSPEAAALAGAELVAGAGWCGLRSHPRPGGSVTYGGPRVPEWLDEALRSIAGVPGPGSDGDERGARPERSR